MASNSMCCNTKSRKKNRKKQQPCKYVWCLCLYHVSMCISVYILLCITCTVAVKSGETEGVFPAVGYTGMLILSLISY